MPMILARPDSLSGSKCFLCVLIKYYLSVSRCGAIIIIHNLTAPCLSPQPTHTRCQASNPGSGASMEGIWTKADENQFNFTPALLVGFRSVPRAPGELRLNEMYLELNVFPFIYQSSRLRRGSDIRRPNTIEKLSTSRLILD